METRVQWPTVGVALGASAAWLSLTWYWHTLPAPVIVVLAGLVLAFHNSIQHEAVHIPPTRSRTLNLMLAGLPLSLWLPLPLYRASHLEHHRIDALTDPVTDPESFYVDGERWHHTGWLGKRWLRAEQTLLGRLLLGPARMVVGFLCTEARRLWRGDRSHLSTWVWHGVGVGVVLAWVSAVCGIGVIEYIALSVWPGLSLTLLRSFAEHRPATRRGHCSAVVESNPIFGLLFLYNNLHALHHAEPWRPWYQLPRRYRQVRDQLLRDNGGLMISGYGDIVRRFLLGPMDHPVHPDYRAQSRHMEQSE